MKIKIEIEVNPADYIERLNVETFKGDIKFSLVESGLFEEDDIKSIIIEE